MTSVQEDKIHSSMQGLCDNVLNLDNVRFAGLVSNHGNLYAGGFKEGIIPYEDDEKRRLIYMRFALESCLRSDFDDSFGAFIYSTVQREKVSILTINICDHILLVFAEPDIDLHTLAGRIQSIIDENEAIFH
ncbi:DUF6659 family protein [Nitrosopumilus sp.]|uniref:DUF6659 family protein n=1 Tax=Nitrosopumilus sp. TaxID=2024843 RepID=UPI00292CB939|nr:DUF6659 family protein [Nitrosopumilus sp.]